MSPLLRRKPTSGRHTPNYPLIGVLAVLAVGIFIYGAFTKRVPFVPHYHIAGVFSTSNQIIKGSPVRIAGVDVGQVSKISNGPGSTTIVTMEIKNEGRPIHKDATLKIRPRLFLEGGYYVQVDPGSPSAPELKSGATVPLPQTAVPVQFHQLLAGFNRPTREGLKTVIDKLAVALGGGGVQALRRTTRELAPTFKSVAILTHAAQGSAPGDVSNLVRGASRVTGALADNDRQLADLITSFNRTAAALASRDADLAATIRGVDLTVRAAPPALRALDRALPAVDAFATALRPSLRIAPPILTRTAALLVQLDALARPTELPRLVSRLRPALGDLPTLEQRLDALFPLVTPVVTCVRDRAVPVLNAKLDDGALSTGRPVWQNLAHVAVGLAGAAQDFDGNGSWVRYLSTGGSATVSTGAIPGVDQFFGTTAQPIEGSRPQWLGSQTRPPFQPDAPCTQQPAPDLHARTGPGMKNLGRARRPRVSLGRFERILLHPKLGRKAR
jgi:phospholipid/cholesterol/gamma-HCH transport system substrate-binding protein